MKATTEMKFVVPNGRGVNQKGIFKLVPASQLSLNDNFMNHIPKTEREMNFMKKVKKVIRDGMYDFWCPVCDPSLDNKGRIYYEPGNKPALGKPYYWWKKTAKEFKPEQGSRLGTETERIAFLAVLIKELVNSGKSVEWAWNAVCNDSKELGHYRNSENAKHAYEDTGNREVCGYCDLGNVYKIVAKAKEAGGWCGLGKLYKIVAKAKEDDGFELMGGNFAANSDNSPLADLYYGEYKFCFANLGSCGWIVLTKGSADH